MTAWVKSREAQDGGEVFEVVKHRRGVRGRLGQPSLPTNFSPSIHSRSSRETLRGSASPRLKTRMYGLSPHGRPWAGPGRNGRSRSRSGPRSWRWLHNRVLRPGRISGIFRRWRDDYVRRIIAPAVIPRVVIPHPVIHTAMDVHTPTVITFTAG
jgi:hypothetical protein